MRERAGERTIASLSAAHAAGAGEDNAPKQLELADAAGKHAFIGTKETLESSYLVITTAPGAAGETVYTAYPVSEWYTFNHVDSLPHRSAEEQVELQEKLQSYGERPTAAVLQRAKRDAGPDWAAEGGRADAGGDVIAEAQDEAVSYREGLGHRQKGGGSRGGGRGGGGGEDGEDGDDFGGGEDRAAEDLEGAYGALEGDEPGGADGDGGAGGGRFDVVGDGGEAVEGAADLEIAFEDDAGDAGEEADYEALPARLSHGAGTEGADDAETADAVFGAGAGGGGDLDDDEAEAGAAGGAGGSARVDVDGDEELDAGAVSKRYADALAAAVAARAKPAASAAEEEEEDDILAGVGAGAAAKRGRATGADDGAAAASTAPASKRARLEAGASSAAPAVAPPAQKAQYVDPITALRDRIRRLVVSHGGRVTMKAVSREFGRELKAADGEAFKATLMSVMKALTRRVKAADGETIEYLLKDKESV